MKIQSCKPLLLLLLLAVTRPDASAQALTFTTNTVTLASGSGPKFIVLTDVNQDARLDLISANSQNNKLTVLTNAGGGVFVTNANLNAGNSPQAVTAADLNGDEAPDLICANNGDGTLTVFTNNGSGKFGSNATLNVFSAPRNVLAADINGDGKLDLISANSESFPDYTGTLTVLTNNGSGRFGSNAVLNVDSSPNAVVAADVNGDGKPDLISANSGGFPDFLGTLDVLTNNGTGQFTASTTIALNDPSGPVSLIAAEVNGDGKTDLICANSDANTLSVYTNNGTGIFSLAATLDVGSSPNFVTASDLNGDGKLDLACVNFADNTLTLLTNSGQSVFGLNTTLALGLNPACIKAADVNNDGKPDLISANYGENKLKVLLNNSFFPSSAKPLLSLESDDRFVRVSWPSVSPGWSLVESGTLLQPPPWLPSGFGGFEITDVGTNKTLSLPATRSSRFFKLLHP